MPPLFHYTPQLARSAAAPAAQAPSVQAAPVNNDAAAIARHVDNFMKTAGPLMGAAYQREQTARVDDHLLEASRKMQAWQAEYEQTHTGSNGVDAARDFAQAWADITKETRKSFDGSSHEIFDDLLARRLAERGQTFAGRGLAFAARQREIWEQSQWQSQQDDYYRNVSAYPDDAASILREREALKGKYAAMHPGEDNRAAFAKIDEDTQLKRMEAALVNGDVDAFYRMKDDLLSRKAHPKLGDTIAKGESGSEGIHCVNYLPTDGTAYGKWQLSSKQGSYQEWINFLGSKAAQDQFGPIAAEISKQLKAAGPANTGTNSGRPVEAYKALARQYPELIEESQRIFLKQSHYDGALQGVPKALRDLIANDPRLMEMTFSTAVQMGPKGCADIYNKVYQPGMSPEQFIRAAYAERGQPYRFKSSAPDVQRSVAARCAREGEELISLPLGRSVVDPKKLDPLIRRAEALRREKQLAASSEMQNRIRQYIASSEDGNIMDLPYSEGELITALGPEAGARMYGDLLSAQQLASDAAAMKELSVSELATFVTSRAPQVDSQNYVNEARRHGRLIQIAARQQEAMQKNPAGFMLSVSPPLQAAREKLLTELQEGQLTPGTASAYVMAMTAAQQSRELNGPLFSREDRAALGSAIMTAADPVAIIQNVNAAFGDRAPQIFKELAGNVSPTVHVIAGMNMQAEPARRLLKAMNDNDFEKKGEEILRLVGSDKKDYEEQVWDEIKDLNASLMASGDTILPQALRDGVYRLGLIHMQRSGLKPKDAIKLALQEVVNDRYEMVKQGGFFRKKSPCFRIPREQPVALIQEGLKKTLSSVPMERVLVRLLPGIDETQGMQAIQETLARSGHWVTNADESGAILYLGEQPVYGKDEKPLTFSWQELAELGSTQVTERQNWQASGVTPGQILK